MNDRLPICEMCKIKALKAVLRKLEKEKIE